MTSLQVYGTHLIGGDLTYRRLAGNQFEVTLKLFRDCNTGQAGFDATIEIGVFERNTHVLLDSATILLFQTYPLALNMPGTNCSPPPNVCGEAGLYRDTILLADNPNGYYISWQRCCRNTGIVNLVNGLETGMVYYVEVPDPAIINNSAIFNYDPLPFVCEGQLFELDYSAADADGDSLVFKLAEPLAGTLGHPLQSNPQAILIDQVPGPYPQVEWTPGYNLANVFSSNPPASINILNGLLSAKADQLGLFAIAFEVFEYRNGILISLIRREIEISSVVCANLPPDLETDSLPGNLTFHIYESDTLCFNATYTDADGDNLELTFSGNVFGGFGMISPFATATTDSALVTVSSAFCWNTRCGHGRVQPYTAVFEVQDDGCPMPAMTLDSVMIFVHPMPQAGPVNLQCIGLVDGHTNRVKWVDTAATAAYTEKFEVYRSYNGGAYMLLATVINDTVDFYDDPAAFNNDTDNYCYYVIAYNKCGDAGPRSDTLCSSGQGNAKLNYIEYVTVINDREIELKWEDFPDGPFSTLYIYRSANSAAASYELRATLENSTLKSWTDQSVNPDESSYCYYMLNRDQCGGISQQGNQACSILLEGVAESWINLLKFSSYREWTGGVDRYEIFRKTGEHGNFQVTKVNPDSVLVYDDGQLDASQGKYYYFIKAWEGEGSANAFSISNEIELLQDPFIFLPNAFTPNNDSRNDNWEGHENFVKEITVSIYNRWGELVYAGSGVNAGWDGTYEGKNAPEGIYIYQVNYNGFGNGQQHTVRGTISLIR